MQRPCTHDSEWKTGSRSQELALPCRPLFSLQTPNPSEKARPKQQSGCFQSLPIELCSKCTSVLACWRGLRVLIGASGQLAQRNLSSILFRLFHKSSIVPKARCVLHIVDHRDGRPGSTATCRKSVTSIAEGQETTHLDDRRRLDR